MLPSVLQLSTDTGTRYPFALVMPAGRRKIRYVLERGTRWNEAFFTACSQVASPS